MNDSLRFIGYLLLGVVAFVYINIYIDGQNPCSNFYKGGDICSQRFVGE